MASVAKARWAIEQFYEDAKGECGLCDYQEQEVGGLHQAPGALDADVPSRKVRVIR